MCPVRCATRGDCRKQRGSTDPTEACPHADTLFHAFTSSSSPWWNEASRTNT